MSAGMASSTETIFVRLLGEGVEVWRPVRATSLGGSVFRIDETAVPADEDWEFQPGALVLASDRPDGRGLRKIAHAAATSPTRRVG